jgi:hypothetical protein
MAVDSSIKQVACAKKKAPPRACPVPVSQVCKLNAKCKVTRGKCKMTDPTAPREGCPATKSTC